MCERLLNLQEIYVSGQNICIEVYGNSVGTITPIAYLINWTDPFVILGVGGGEWWIKCVIANRLPHLMPMEQNRTEQNCQFKLEFGSHLNLGEPLHDKTNKMACTPSEDSDQPGRPPSLIRVFTVRFMGSQ